MKCSISVAPRVIKTKGGKDMLAMATANVWLDVVGLDGSVVVPMKLMSMTDNNGKYKAPFLGNGQPTYEAKDGKKKVSYQNVHLDGTLAQAVEKIVTVEWVKNEVKRLRTKALGTAGDYIWDKKSASWTHDKDRVYTTANGADEDLMTDMIGLAQEFAAKAATNEATTGSAQNDATVESVLGASK
jgi:hypothetical protein